MLLRAAGEDGTALIRRIQPPLLVRLGPPTWQHSPVREVCNGITGHTETIKITYDQDIVPYSSLLEIFFLFHDPTTLNRQGNDIGTQYRSAIFYNNLEEKNQIHACIDQFEKDKIYSDPIVTEINIECPFYPAEVEHHNYYNRNSEQPYCHYVITPKIKKLESLFKQYTILE